LCTCKAAANRSYVYVSGKNNLIIHISIDNARYINQRRVKGRNKQKKPKKHINLRDIMSWDQQVEFQEIKT
jgi:hypothetical protein